MLRHFIWKSLKILKRDLMKEGMKFPLQSPLDIENDCFLFQVCVNKRDLRDDFVFPKWNFIDGGQSFLVLLVASRRFEKLHKSVSSCHHWNLERIESFLLLFFFGKSLRTTKGDIFQVSRDSFAYWMNINRTHQKKPNLETSKKSL